MGSGEPQRGEVIVLTADNPRAQEAPILCVPMLWVGHGTWREVLQAVSVATGKMTRRMPPNTEVTLQVADALVTG